MKKASYFLFALFFCQNIFAQKNTHTLYRLSEENWKRYVVNGAGKFHPTENDFFMYLDSAIMVYPDDAFLWQQKAISNYKIKRFDEAKTALKKAVMLDSTEYSHYAGFVQCIFENDYKNALQSLQFPTNDRKYIADHTAVFYQGICYLQNKKTDDAINCFLDEIKFEKQEVVHYLNYFYVGIAYYEKDSFAKAIDFFDKSMSRYSDFSDAEFYKAMSLMKLKNNLSKPLFEKALGDFDKGYTFTEEYAIYQIYPYQITREQIEFFIQKNSK